MFRREKRLVKFLYENIIVCAGIIMFVFSVFIRWHFRDVVSGDYEGFLRPWCEAFQEKGLSALKEPIGDYYIPYMMFVAFISYLPGSSLYWYKILSIVFDYALASVGAMIAYKIYRNKMKAFFAGFILALSPIVILNSAAWAQCDSIYATFILLSLYFLLDKKYLKCFLFLGIAFCFKFQTIFIFPIFIFTYLVKKEFSILYFSSIPMIYLLAGLPSIIAGRSAVDVYSIYFKQISNYQELTLNMPNIYSFTRGGGYDAFFIPGILITITFIIAMTVYIIYKKYHLENDRMILLAAWFHMTCILFFPAMHERYSYVFIILICCCMLKKDKLYIPLLLSFVSMLTYCAFLFGISYNQEILAAINLSLWFVCGYELCREQRK